VPQLRIEDAREVRVIGDALPRSRSRGKREGKTDRRDRRRRCRQQNRRRRQLSLADLALGRQPRPQPHGRDQEPLPQLGRRSQGVDREGKTVKKAAPGTIRHLATETFAISGRTYYHAYMDCNCGALFFRPSQEVPTEVEVPGVRQDLPGREESSMNYEEYTAPQGPWTTMDGWNAEGVFTAVKRINEIQKGRWIVGNVGENRCARRPAFLRAGSADRDWGRVTRDRRLRRPGPQRRPVRRQFFRCFSQKTSTP